MSNNLFTPLEVHQTLLNHFGPVDWRPGLPPVDELVSTILSQSTTDLNRDRAFDRLKETFPSWEAVAEAEVTAIQDAIRVAGLAKQKAPSIKGALQFILETQGELTLEFLREMPVDEARAWLIQIKGVGIKTASIVLLFSLDMPAFPVDTHVHRTTRRLGVIPPKTTAEKAHHLLEAALPPESYFDAHLNLIRLGREICQARQPKCQTCFLRDRCLYYQENP